MPASHPSKYSQLKTVISSFLLPHLLYTVLTEFTYNEAALYTASACGLLLVTISLLGGERLYRLQQAWYSLACFVGALAWMMLVVDVVMSFLTFLAVLTDTSKLFLGLTLMAVANCLGDWFSYVGSARAGMGMMAVAGVFGGQLFNLIVGFGATLLYHSIANGGRVSF